MNVFGKKKNWTLTIQEELPDDMHKKVALALSEGIINNDFSAFESMLDKNVRWEWPVQNRGPIVGCAEVVAYWKDWVRRISNDVQDIEFNVKFCTYYSRTILSISPKGYATTFVLFYIEDDLVKLGVFANKLFARINILGKPEQFGYESLDNFPFALNDKDIKEISCLETSYDDRMPCLSCGKTSGSLSWNKVAFSNSSIDFYGAVSKCPSCGKVVEFVFGKECVLHDSNRWEPFTVKKEEEGVQMTDDTFRVGLYYLMPLRHSKYIASLSKRKSISMKIPDAELKTSPYAAATCFMEQVLFVLYMKDYDEYENIKNCYINALDDGVYEAANNLGILTYNVEGLDKEKGLEYFRIAAEHNSKAAIDNLVQIFWHEKRYGDLISLLKEDDGRNDLEVEGNLFQRILKYKLFESHLDYSQFVFALFPEIETVKDWHISVKMCSVRNDTVGDESCFYLANSKDGMTEFKIWKYIVMPKSKRAIWELYLLMKAESLLPSWWHGTYLRRTFIFGANDFSKIPILRDRDMSALIERGYTHPSVAIEECEGGFYAHVYCCYWNEWKGLVREHVVMRVQEDRVVEYDNEEDFVIFPYHCGVFY